MKPYRAQEILSFTEYQFRLQLMDFVKRSISPERISATQVLLQASVYCSGSSSASSKSELFIIREELHDGTAGTFLKEGLYLKTCNKRVELFSLERQGSNVVPIEDTELFRANLPSLTDLNLFRLNMMDQDIRFEMRRSAEEQKMDVKIGLGTDGNEFRLQFRESHPEKPLTRQYVRFIYQESGIIQDDFNSDYTWNLDPKNGVPRQYLFIRQKESSPGDFLIAKDRLFNQTIFSTLTTQLQDYFSRF